MGMIMILVVLCDIGCGMVWVCDGVGVSMGMVCMIITHSHTHTYTFIGTPALTSRGFTEEDFVTVARFFDRAVRIALDVQKKTSVGMCMCVLMGSAYVLGVHMFLTIHHTQYTIHHTLFRRCGGQWQDEGLQGLAGHLRPLLPGDRGSQAGGDGLCSQVPRYLLLGW